MIYPREPHGLREPAHLLDFMRRIIGWLDKHVKAAVREYEEFVRES